MLHLLNGLLKMYFCVEKILISMRNVSGFNIFNQLFNFDPFLIAFGIYWSKPVWISQNSNTENILETAISDGADVHELYEYWNEK